ncbi:MAG: IPT/TIG domain-containing protein, partial [Bacteriovorax sp.]|nr:IPT/TIG domain-containing protein [Bacteriovorax sp.]
MMKISQFIKSWKLQFEVRSLIYLFIILFLAGCKPERKANPVLSSISPTAGNTGGGNLVTLTGSDLPSSPIVSIGNKVCTVVSSGASQITCTTASNSAGTYNVVVTGSNRQSITLASAYSYSNGPTVTSVAPISGFAIGGTIVTVSGTNFISGASVTLGGSSCTGATVVNSSTITCTAPAHATGVVSAVVTNPDLVSASQPSAFTFRAAPTVSSVSANAGALGGGTSVTITGSGFYTGASITFGGSACTAVTTINPTTITCTTPAHAAGAVTVTVTNADTQTGSAAAAYTYQAAPTVTSVSPLVGPAGGSTTTTISGTGFLTGATVTFGGSTCTLPIVVNSTTIQCTTPVHAAGAVTVLVRNADTQTGSLGSAFTYLVAPTVSSVSANAGALAGGTAVTITGTNFLAGATATIGGVNCTTLTVVTSTSITCTSGAHAAGTVDAVVTNIDSQFGTGTNTYRYQAAPTVTSASPTYGALAGGTSITITGTGFVTGATVNVGGSTCTTPVVSNSTTMTCTTPAHAAGAVTITVTNADTQTGNAAAAFTYQAAPTVTSVAATSGFAVGGTSVTITGTAFLSGATATFGGVACTSLTVVNATTITCTTAAHAAGAVTVAVTNSDAQSGSAAAVFTYVAAPTVTSVSLNGGNTAGATAVTITGTGFVAGATVDFGGCACTGVTVVSATSITCTTPANAAGAVAVAVTNTDTQAGSTASAFTYRVAPTVTSVAANA